MDYGNTLLQTSSDIVKLSWDETYNVYDITSTPYTKLNTYPDLTDFDTIEFLQGTYNITSVNYIVDNTQKGSINYS